MLTYPIFKFYLKETTKLTYFTFGPYSACIFVCVLENYNRLNFSLKLIVGNMIMTFCCCVALLMIQFMTLIFEQFLF